MIRKENLLGDKERECLENREKGEFLNQQSNVCVSRQEHMTQLMILYVNVGGGNPASISVDYAKLYPLRWSCKNSSIIIFFRNTKYRLVLV